MTSADVPRVPDGTGPAGRALWRKITATYELAPAELALLARAARVTDLLARIDRALAADGLTVTGSQGQPRPHPLLASASDLSRTLAALLREMALPAPWQAEGERQSPAQRAAAQERWRRHGPVA